jgi:hypothetical protein
VSRIDEDVTPEFYNRLADVIIRRYMSNADKSLWDVYQLDEDFVILEPDGMDFTVTHRDKIVAVLNDPALFARLVEVFVKASLDFTYTSNQFVRINSAEEQQLRRLYQGYLADMRAILASDGPADGLKERFEALVAAHFEDLKTNLTRFFDRETGQDVRANVILNRTVCREYSPEFQLDMLGIHLHDLVEPVLDIGCGRAGALVKYLNARGIHSMGIDRVVEDSPDLQQMDWLDLRLNPESWGTIISHMAFSNHFIFHHLYKNGSPEAFARQYMTILNALKHGGSFYYTPGLPFIEQYLPAQNYAIRRKPVANPVAEELPPGRGIPREALLYAARVTRR